MKLEAVVFLLCGFFLGASAVVYIVVTGFEPAGSVALLLSGALSTMVGGYFWFISRRIDARPEDRTDGEIIDGAGDLGFFAPGSYYPIGLASVVVVLGIGIAFWYPWLMILGGVSIIGMVVGLTLEFYTNQNKDHTAVSAPNVNEHV